MVESLVVVILVWAASKIGAGYLTQMGAEMRDSQKKSLIGYSKGSIPVRFSVAISP